MLYLLASSNTQTLLVSLNKEIVLPCPMEYSEFWVECKQEGFTVAIETVAVFQFTGSHCTKYLWKQKDHSYIKKQQIVSTKMTFKENVRL